MSMQTRALLFFMGCSVLSIAFAVLSVVKGDWVFLIVTVIGAVVSVRLVIQAISLRRGHVSDRDP